MSNIQITENESGKYSPDWFYNEAQIPECISLPVLFTDITPSCMVFKIYFVSGTVKYFIPIFLLPSPIYSFFIVSCKFQKSKHPLISDPSSPVLTI